MSMPVNITTDIVLEAAAHEVILPPFINPSVAGTVQGHLPGIWTHTAKLAHTVTHKGQALVQQRHDCGPMIPHLTLPTAANPLYVTILPGSSCKVMFGASTVKANGKSMGIAGAGGGGIFPMMTCARPVSAPLALPATSFLNTVKVGVSLRDRLSGCVGMALKMLSDGIGGWFFPSSSSKVGSTAMELVTQMIHKLFPSLPASKKALGKLALKTGLATLSRFAVSTLEGNPTFQVSMGKPLARVKVKLKVKPEEGQVQVGHEVNVVGMRHKDGRVSMLGEELR